MGPSRGTGVGTALAGSSHRLGAALDRVTVGELVPVDLDQVEPNTSDALRWER
jgi:hypothetical protein